MRKRITDEEFRPLVEEYMDYVYSVAYRIMGNAEDARDASQDTFFKLYTKYHLYNPAQSLKNWICSIAVNTCRDMFRSRKRFIPLDVENEAIVSDRGAGSRGVENRLQAEKMLLALPFDYRTVMIFFYLEQKSVKEISKMLKIPEILVKVRMHRARKQLLKQFGDTI